LIISTQRKEIFTDFPVTTPKNYCASTHFTVPAFAAIVCTVKAVISFFLSIEKEMKAD